MQQNRGGEQDICHNGRSVINCERLIEIRIRAHVCWRFAKEREGERFKRWRHDRTLLEGRENCTRGGDHQLVTEGK